MLPEFYAGLAYQPRANDKMFLSLGASGLHFGCPSWMPVIILCLGRMCGNDVGGGLWLRV